MPVGTVAACRGVLAAALLLLALSIPSDAAACGYPIGVIDTQTGALKDMFAAPPPGFALPEGQCLNAAPLGTLCNEQLFFASISTARLLFDGQTTFCSELDRDTLRRAFISVQLQLGIPLAVFAAGAVWLYRLASRKERARRDSS